MLTMDNHNYRVERAECVVRMKNKEGLSNKLINLIIITDLRPLIVWIYLLLYQSAHITVTAHLVPIEHSCRVKKTSCLGEQFLGWLGKRISCAFMRLNTSKSPESGYFKSWVILIQAKFGNHQPRINQEVKREVPSL